MHRIDFLPTHTHTRDRGRALCLNWMNVSKHVHVTFQPKIKREFIKGIILCMINKKPVLFGDIIIKHISPPVLITVMHPDIIIYSFAVS